MTLKERAERIAEISELRDLLKATFEGNIRVFPKIVQLIDNSNAGISFAMLKGDNINFPPSRFDPTVGKLFVHIYLVDKDADIYYPGTTCPIDVATIEPNHDANDFVPRLKLTGWNSKMANDADGRDYRRISSYKNGPHVLPDIPEKEVKEMFYKLQKDIREIFDEIHST